MRLPPSAGHSGIFERASRLGDCVEASAIPAAQPSSRILKGHSREDEKSSSDSNDKTKSKTEYS
jgi:hypothetical protein